MIFFFTPGALDLIFLSLFISDSSSLAITLSFKECKYGKMKFSNSFAHLKYIVSD